MYFEEKGAVNTESCLKIAVEEAKKRNIGYLVVASHSGDTARRLAELAGDLQVICVTQAYGASEPGIHAMTDEACQQLQQQGIKVLATTHVLSGAERGISKKHGGISPVEIMADTLRMFGQGTKVCVEVAVMALDAGLIPHGEEIIALGGSSRGADTALVLRPAHACNILDNKICEVLCKPRNW